MFSIIIEFLNQTKQNIIIIMKSSFMTHLKQTVNPQQIESARSKLTSTNSFCFDVQQYYKNYTLHQNLFTKSQLQNQDHFTILKGKNYVYFGGLKDGIKQGWGVLIVGEILYEGEFQNNHKSGNGYQKQKKGGVYNGQFRESLFDGYGTMMNADGSRYTGDFRRGFMEGEGMWVNGNGDKYIGQWVGGKASGRGVLISSRNEKYQGEFKEFVKNGEGIETFANGDVFKGSYQGNTPNGYGQYYWKNGNVFKGTFKNGLKHGRGLWRSTDGDSYQGQYQNDKKSGTGEMRWGNGNIYIGEFFNDLRHGQGQMKWINGTQFFGMWQKGIPDGPGVLSSAKKGERHGIFKNNVMVAESKHWKEPEGLKRTRKHKTSDRNIMHYEKLKPIPERVRGMKKRSFQDEKTRSRVNSVEKKTTVKRFFAPPKKENKYKVVQFGYRNSSMSVGTRGFPIYIKPNLSQNSSPINIKIRIQRTKKGLDITAKQLGK